MQRGGVITPLDGYASSEEEEDSDDPGDEDPFVEDPFSKRSVTFANRVTKHGKELVHCLEKKDRLFVNRWVSLKSPAA